MSLLVLFFLYAISGVQAQATYLCNEKFSSKKPSGWDILPTHSLTAPSWKPDTGICVSAKYSMHGMVPYNTGDTATLVTPYFDCTNYKHVMIRFSHICKLVPSDICRIEYQEDVLGSANKWKVLPYDSYMGNCGTYRQDSGFSHSSYAIWDMNDTFAKPTNSWWKEESFIVSDYAGYSKVRFRFIIRKGKDVSSFIAAGWYVDDFQVLVSKFLLNPPVVEFTKKTSDTVYSVGPYVFEAKVATRSDAPIKQPWFHYTATNNNKSTHDSIKMTAVTGDSIWTATIPQHIYNTTFTYWIHAFDSAGNSTRVSGNFTNKYFPGGIVKLNGDSTQFGSTSTGVQNCSFPFMLAGTSDSWVRVLYMADHIRKDKSGGYIGAMGFYTTNTVVNTHDNVKIYLKATTTTSLTALGTTTIDPIKDGATLVYQGTITGHNGWNQYVFDRCFYLPPGMNLMWYMVDDDPQNQCNSSVIYWMRNTNQTYNSVDRYGHYSCSSTTSGTITDLPTTMFYFGKPMGAPDSNGVAMESIDNPLEGTTAGKQTVKVTIRNTGINDLTSAKLGWSVNGVVQNTVTYSRKLPCDFTDTITLGSYIQRAMAYDTITVWVNTPNNTIDTNVIDDTLTVVAFGCDSLLKGDYTIGSGSQYDFATLSDALSIIEKCGMGGDVTLKIATGTYSENIKLSNLNVAGNHHITITSIAGHRDSVVFRPKTGPVVSLNSCAGLAFKDLTFDATKAKPTCITMGTGLDNIEFSHCMIHGFDTAMSNNTFSTIYRFSGAPIHNIRFIGNEIIGGSYGIYFNGSSTTARNSNIVFDSNHVENYYSYAAYIYYNNNLKVTHNRFDGARSGNNYDYGVYVYYSDSSLFDANRFHNKGLNQYVYGGLHTYYTDSFTVISNNEIVLKNAQTTSYGLYVYYTSGTKVVNNSILLNGSNTTSYGLYVYTGSTAYYADIRNNISVCLSTGSTNYPNYFTSATYASNFNVDYNCWWSKSNVGYVGGAKTTLAAFRTSIPSAVHDLYKQPVFVHSDTSSLLKDNTGMDCPKTGGVNHDVDGKLRVAKTIMGAYTNELPRMNGALTEIVDLPGTSMIADTLHPYAVLMNAGTDTLREATIRVEIDHVVQGSDIVWKGQLATGETANVPLGFFMLKNNSHQFTAYLTGIGSLKDSITSDDTVHATTYTCAGRMAGSFTIGGTSPDFNTPAEAIKMINLCGVSGPVTLKLRSGSYDAIKISGTVPGASRTNTITVIPDQGAKVVIDKSSGTALSIQNSGHWHFSNITFGNTKNGITGVELEGGVEDVSFRHCNIYASITANATNYCAVSYPNSSGASSYPVDVEFVGNHIQGGYYNMYLNYIAGSTANMQASSMTVDSNVLTDAYYCGIYAYYYAHYKSMSHNTITNRKGCTNVYYGIYNYYYCNVDNPVEGNRVHVTTTGTGYGIYWYYYKNSPSYGGTTTGKFVNNEIMVEGTGGAKYGLYFYYPYQDWEVCHNSVFAKSTNGTVYGIYAYNSTTSYKITLKNNLFVTEGTGTNYPINAGSYYTNSYIVMDYNNYVSLNNSNIGYAGALITSLSNWKSTTVQNQHSVNVKTAFTDSTKNFELDDYMPFICPKLNSAPNDINGASRTNTTTMGCYSIPIKEDVDLGVVSFLSPKPITDVTCFPDSMPVQISLKNSGLKQADFSHSALKVSLDITGAINYHSDTTFTTGSMNFQQIDTIALGSIPTLVSGIYQIRITLNDTSDTNLDNDTMSLLYKVGRVELPYDIDFSTEPNEFINVTMAGSTEWKVVKGTGNNPALAPAFGTGRLEFAGEKDPGAYTHAVFNGVNIQGCVKPTLSFWYAHNANCTGQDMLTVLITTDGGANYTEIRRILVADTVTTWKQYDIDLSAFTQSSCLSVVFRAISFGGTNQCIDRIRITASQDAAISLLPISTDNRTACDNTPVDVKAVITNLSRMNIDMFNDTLTLNVTGAVSYSNKVVYNHRLGSFESDTVTLGQISLDANGAYYFEAFMQSFDDKSVNDTITDSTLFVMQDIALDTVLGLDNQMFKMTGENVNVNSVAVNNGNITVDKVIFHMSIDGHLVVSDTVSQRLYPGDTLIHPMSQPFTVPAVSKDQPFYFFELKTELACDADNTNDVINIVGQVNIPDSIDIQVLEITTTEQALGNTKLSPSVRVANIGNLEADNIVVHVEVINDSDRVVESISEIISHMAINETKNHNFTMTYKVPNYTGKYTLKAYVEAFDGDSIHSNDTLAKQFRCYRDSVGIHDAEQLDWSLGQNIPNPASEVTAIPFTLPQEGMVRLSVMGANGQVIFKQEFQGEAGGNRLELNTGDWAGGLYYYTMEYRGQRITRKMTVTR